jgi:YHS domain-containing protein
MRSTSTVHALGRSVLACALLACFALGAAAVQGKPRDVTHFNLGKLSLALAGYDPVAYFAEGGGKPAKGEAKFELVHDGVRYRFASEAHKALFVKNPAQYEPTYGGWCAFAMAERKKVEVDPESFVVREGRLFLFYDGWFNDTRAKWLLDPVKLTQRADREWAELIAPPKPKTERGQG